MNPFTLNPESGLNNIITGKMVSDEIAKEQGNLMKTGEKWHQEFVEECFQDDSRFYRQISNRKAKKFVSGAKLQSSQKMSNQSSA